MDSTDMEKYSSLGRWSELNRGHGGGECPRISEEKEGDILDAGDVHVQVLLIVY